MANAATAQRTTRRGLKPAQELTTSAAIEVDTIMLDSLVISGYEKPLQSNRETLHLTNRTPLSLTSIALRIDYTDFQGRQLHTRTVTLKIDIPAGQTRLLEFKSWDPHHRYYYLHGPRPRVEAYPYTIIITPVEATAAPAQE